jgi:hypothetical protein
MLLSFCGGANALICKAGVAPRRAACPHRSRGPGKYTWNYPHHSKRRGSSGGEFSGKSNKKSATAPKSDDAKVFKLGKSACKGDRDLIRKLANGNAVDQVSIEKFIGGLKNRFLIGMLRPDYNTIVCPRENRIHTTIQSELNISIGFDQLFKVL